MYGRVGCHQAWCRHREDANEIVALDRGSFAGSLKISCVCQSGDCRLLVREECYGCQVMISDGSGEAGNNVRMLDRDGAHRGKTILQ